MKATVAVGITNTMNASLVSLRHNDLPGRRSFNLRMMIATSAKRKRH
jgi:hypothetical protein